MYIHNCPQCGQQYSTEERVSPVKCPNCGTVIDVNYSDQPEQPQQPQQPGYQQQQQPGYQQQQQQPGYQQQGYQQPQYATKPVINYGNIFDPGPSGKCRGITALFAFLFGWLGIHYFYLGKTVPGIVFILVSVVTCGTLTAIASLIQGIMLMVSTTQEEFENKWVNPMNSFPLF